jgi:macrodomain Ter protein organizer (MatP/YcbG family)
MDTSKFKSVTISIETWKMLHELAETDMRSVSRTIEFLVNKYKQEQEKDNG